MKSKDPDALPRILSYAFLRVQRILRVSKLFEGFYDKTHLISAETTVFVRPIRSDVALSDLVTINSLEEFCLNRLRCELETPTWQHIAVMYCREK